LNSLSLPKTFSSELLSPWALHWMQDRFYPGRHSIHIYIYIYIYIYILWHMYSMQNCWAKGTAVAK
jgi:hypothetical protein